MANPTSVLSVSSPEPSAEIALPGSTNTALANVQDGKKAVEAPKDKHSRMTPGQLDEALTLHSPVLLKNLYEAAQRQITFETGRQGRLDAKATGLLQAAGLSLTVGSTFGAQLAARTTKAPALLLVVIGVVLVLGLAAAGMAIRALRVRQDYGTVNERTLFAKDLLADADSHEKDKQDEAVTMFYRTMTAHLWEIVQQQEKTHGDKAELIRKGQAFFGGFLLGVLVLGLVLLASYR